MPQSIKELILSGFKLIEHSKIISQKSIVRLTGITLISAFILNAYEFYEKSETKTDTHKKVSNAMLTVTMEVMNVISRLDIAALQFEVLATTSRLKELPKMNADLNRQSSQRVYNAIDFNNVYFKADQLEAVSTLYDQIASITDSRDSISPDLAKKKIIDLSENINNICNVFKMEKYGLDALCESSKSYYSYGGYVARQLALRKPIPIKS